MNTYDAEKKARIFETLRHVLDEGGFESRKSDNRQPPRRTRRRARNANPITLNISGDMTGNSVFIVVGSNV